MSDGKYAFEKSKIIHGDCLVEMKNIPDKSIDMVFTDLPYGQTQCKWDSVIDLDLFWKECNRTTKFNAAIVLTAIEPFASILRMSNIKNYKYDWVWKKNKPSGALNANRMPMRNHEMVLVFYKKQPTYNKEFEARECTEASTKRLEYAMTGFAGSNTMGNTKKEKYKYDTKLRNPTTVKNFNLVPNPKRVHPTEKPISLIEYMVKTYTNEGEIVADFTAGSGTTGAACINLKRDFILIEKELNYYEIIKERLGNFKNILV